MTIEYRKTTAVEPAEVLRAVADEIERVGWAQEKNVDETGAVCLYGGLNAVLVGVPEDGLAVYDPRYRGAYELLVERVEARAGTRPSFWNDTRVAVGDVLEMLRGD